MTKNIMSYSKGVKWTFLSRIIFIVSNYFIQVFLARGLTPAVYGIWGIIFTSINLFTNILNNGVPQTAAKFLAEDRSDKREIFIKMLKFQALFALSLGFIFWILSPVFGSFLKDERLIPLFKVAAFFIPAMAIYAVMVNSLNGIKKFSAYSFCVSIYSTSRIPLIILMLWLGLEIRGVLFSYILGLGFAILYAAKELRVLNQDNNADSKADFRYSHIIKLSLPVIVFSIVLNLLMTTDLYLVKRLLSDDGLVGYYVAAVTLSKLPYMLFASFGISLLPSVSSVSKDPAAIDKQVSQATKYLIYLMFPGIIIASTSSREVISFIFTPKYLGASGSLSILIFGAGFFTVIYVFSNVLVALNRAVKPMTVILCLLPINVALNFLLISRYGLTGGAISYLSTSLLGTAIFLFLTRQALQSLFQVKNLLKIILVLGVAYMLSNLIHFSGMMLLIKFLIIYLIVFGLLIIFGDVDSTKLRLIFRPER